MRSAIMATTLLICANVCAGTHEEDNAILEIRKIYARANDLAPKADVQKIDVIVRSPEEDASKPASWVLPQTEGYEAVIVARGFMRNGEPLKVSIDMYHPSADWHYTSEYYFYANGQVAFLFERNVTRHGNLIQNSEAVFVEGASYVLEKRSYFDKSGKRIRHLRKAHIANTGKPIAPDQVEDVGPATDALKFSAFPFYKLLQSRVSLKKD